MKVDLNKVIATTLFSGFGNYGSVPFSAVIAGQNLGAGAVVSAGASTPLNNTNAISQVQVQYTGLDAFWRLLPGVVIADYPNASSPNYQIESFSYFTNGILHVDTYISNQTGGTVAIPAITISCRAFLFLAPF